MKHRDVTAHAEPDDLPVRPSCVADGIRVAICVSAAGAMLAGCASALAGSASSSPSLPSSSPPPSAAAAGTAVSGVVLGEPGCPGPVRLGTPCPPLPMRGATVEVDQAGRPVARATTAADGSFTLRLLSGSYTIIATAAGPLRSTARRSVSIGTSPVSVTLTVDTGMR